MKTILFTVSLFFVNFVYSQVIKIEVSEVMDAYTYDTSMTNLFKNEYVIFEPRKVNTEYIIDLTNKTFEFIRNGKTEIDGDISFEYNNDVYSANLIIDGFKIGLIINSDIYNEQVTWYSVYSDYIEITKFSKFVIVKGS